MSLELMIVMALEGFGYLLSFNSILPPALSLQGSQLYVKVIRNVFL